MDWIDKLSGPFSHIKQNQWRKILTMSEMSSWIKLDDWRKDLTPTELDEWRQIFWQTYEKQVCYPMPLPDTYEKLCALYPGGYCITLTSGTVYKYGRHQDRSTVSRDSQHRSGISVCIYASVAADHAFLRCRSL